MRSLLAALLVVFVASIGYAQTPSASTADREAVVAAVQKFFDTMASKDAAEARKVLMPEGRFFSARNEKNQEVVRSSSIQEFLDTMATRKEKVVERFWKPDVRIRGSIATMWTPYDFWIDGKFSHCGIDAFDLVKTPEGWKISGAVYTVERTGCEPSPLGPLK